MCKKRVILLTNIYGHTPGTNYAGAVYDPLGIAPSILVMGGVTDNR